MTLIEQLEGMGFVQWGTGGHCQALVRVAHGATDVITDMGGCDLPEESDWMLCRYAYAWLEDVGAGEPIESHDSETATGTLLDAIATLQK